MDTNPHPDINVRVSRLGAPLTDFGTIKADLQRRYQAILDAAQANRLALISGSRGPDNEPEFFLCGLLAHPDGRPEALPVPLLQIFPTIPPDIGAFDPIPLPNNTL